jgi:hypothetical protein
MGGQLVNALDTCAAPYWTAGVVDDAHPGGHNPVTRVYTVQLCLLGSLSLYYVVPPQVTISGPAVVQLTGPETVIPVTSTVSGSPDYVSALTYLWSVLTPSGPAQLCPGAQMTEPVLRLCGLVNGTYLFSLAVKDTYGVGATASYRVFANAQPSADLVLDATASPEITLRCNGSTDSEDPLASLVFAWRYFFAPDPSIVPFSEEFVGMGAKDTPRVPEPSVFRPAVFSVTLPRLGTHWFQVTVRDTVGGTSTAVASTTNTVAVFAGHDVIVKEPVQVVSLNGTAVSSGAPLAVVPFGSRCAVDRCLPAHRALDLPFRRSLVTCFLCPSRTFGCSWVDHSLNATGLAWQDVGNYSSDRAMWSTMLITHIPTEVALSWVFGYCVFVDGQRFVMAEVKVIVNRPPTATISASGGLVVALPAASVSLSPAGSNDDDSGDIVAVNWQGKSICDRTHRSATDCGVRGAG